MSSTVPAGPSESASRIKTPSPLVLMAMQLGMPASEAIALASARAAEAARLAAMLAR